MFFVSLSGPHVVSLRVCMCAWGGGDGVLGLTPPSPCCTCQEPTGSARVTSGVSLPPPATRKSEAGPGQSPVLPDALSAELLTLISHEVWGCQSVCVRAGRGV